VFLIMPNFVQYRGVQMIEGWPERIVEAQSQTTYHIDGTEVTRIRYGDETQDWNATNQTCHDCRVVNGEFHVIGCDVEECPSCHEQILTCDCLDDENER
jgi:hypothetical protein